MQSPLVPYFALVFAVAPTCACNGKTDSTETKSPVVGQYVIRGTNVVTATHDPSGAPAGMYAPHGDTRTLVVTAAGGPSFKILDVEGGESFTAELANGMLQAKDAAVVIDPNGGAHAVARLSRTLRNFRWDIANGSFRSADTYVTDVTVVLGGGEGYGFIDERIDGVVDPARHWVHYRADTNFPWDFPHGAACLLGGGDTAEGNLGLAFGATHNDLMVYVQGIGCTFKATSTDGKAFSAPGADCPLDPVMSVAALGILSWTFESFVLDFGAKHVDFVARATRKRDDGQVVDMCLKLDSDVTGDIPF